MLFLDFSDVGDRNKIVKEIRYHLKTKKEKKIFVKENIPHIWNDAKAALMLIGRTIKSKFDCVKFFNVSGSSCGLLLSLGVVSGTGAEKTVKKSYLDPRQAMPSTIQEL